MKRLPFLLLLPALLLMLCACAPKDVWEKDAVEGKPAYTKALPRVGHKVMEGFSFSLVPMDTVSLRYDTVTLKFAADAENRWDIALRIEDSAFRLLGETGRLRPGTFLECLHLTCAPESDDEITVTVTAYDEDGTPVRKTTLYGTVDVSNNW